MGVGGFEAAPPPPAVAGEARFWVENALDTDGTGVAIRTAIKTEANKTNDTVNGGYFIAGGGDAEALLNFTDAATTRVAKLTLSNIEGSNNTNSGFSALRVDDDPLPRCLFLRGAVIHHGRGCALYQYQPTRRRMDCDSPKRSNSQAISQAYLLP